MITGITMASLGAVAWYAPNDKFLMWGGALSLGLGAITGVSVLSMVMGRTTPLMYNIWLYGGLGVFGGYVLYDT